MMSAVRQMHANSNGSLQARRLADPRLLVLGALLVVVLIISSTRPWFPLLCLVACLAVAWGAGIRLRLMLARLLNPALLALLLVFFKAVIGSGWQPSVIGLQEGVLLASRVLAAASVMVLLGTLVSVTEILGALAWLRVPRTLVEIALLAWRYLFVLLDDASVVYSAQKNRLGYCGLRRGLRSFGSLAGLLTVKAFDTSRTITIAMAQRGYDGNLPLALPTRLSTLQSALLGLFAGMALLTWYAQNHGL
jgi:cobalt/nickel transport system permease protein